MVNRIVTTGVILFLFSPLAVGFYTDYYNSQIVEQRMCHFANIGEARVGKLHTLTLAVLAECGEDKPHARVDYLIDTALRHPDATLQCDLQRNDQWGKCHVLP